MDATFAVDFNDGTMEVSETTTFKTYEEAARFFNALPDNSARVLSVFTDFRATTIAWVSIEGRTWITPSLLRVLKDYAIRE